MRLIERDIRLLKDMALSHVLSRDQVIELGYFTSVPRVNSRLKALKDAGFIRVLSTPFFAQSLYSVCPASAELLGNRIAGLLRGRTGSPRFLQHALATTNVRIAMQKSCATSWRFEQQLTTEFRYAGRNYEVRPDGLAVFQNSNTALEVDLGHVAPSKFAQKLKGFEAFVRSGELERCWNMQSMYLSLTVITTGPRRARKLTALAKQFTTFPVSVQTFTDLGCKVPGGWS